jgi:hypothetical protein
MTKNEFLELCSSKGKILHQITLTMHPFTHELVWFELNSHPEQVNCNILTEAFGHTNIIIVHSDIKMIQLPQVLLFCNQMMIKDVQPKGQPC